MQAIDLRWSEFVRERRNETEHGLPYARFVERSPPLDDFPRRVGRDGSEEIERLVGNPRIDGGGA
jgi:hypothetical protein